MVFIARFFRSKLFSYKVGGFLALLGELSIALKVPQPLFLALQIPLRLRLPERSFDVRLGAAREGESGRRGGWAAAFRSGM